VVSELFDADRWHVVGGFDDLTDVTYHRALDQGTVRIAFDRPEVRNAFRPRTVDELLAVLDHARTSADVGCVLLTGNGPSPRDGGWAFCSGGDQRIRGRDGYRYADGDTRGDDGPSRRSGPGATAHPRGAANDPVPAQGRRLRRARMGRRGRTLPARRVRSHDREPGARALQADRPRRRVVRRRIRLRLSGPADRSEAGPGDLLPRSRVHRRRGPPDGHGQRGGPHASSRRSRSSGRRRSTASRRRRRACSSTP
jgi:hypothetical protein